MHPTFIVVTYTISSLGSFRSELIIPLLMLDNGMGTQSKKLAVVINVLEVSYINCRMQWFYNPKLTT